jgi:hypothetical protein
VGGKSIAFTLNGSAVCGAAGRPACPTTDGNGAATLTNINLSGIAAGIYTGGANSGVATTFTGDSDYRPSTGTATLTVNKAVATVVLDGLAQTYDGQPKGVTATSNPAGLSLTIAYDGAMTPPTNAGAYAVVATINDPNYQGGASGTLTIAKATPVITWVPPTDIVYGTSLGNAQLNASASVPGTFTYSPASGTVLDPGSWTLRADFTATDGKNYTTASASVPLNVRYAVGDCLGAPGRMVLPPLGADGTSVFKQGRTVPIKFRVCDAHGTSIGVPGIVAKFRLVQITSGTTSEIVDAPASSTTPASTFRWDPRAQQWIFNLSTDDLAPNAIYTYRITLNDGTAITAQFGLR